MVGEVVEPDMVISVISPDLILKASVLENDKIPVESFKQTFGGVLS